MFVEPSPTRGPWWRSVRWRVRVPSLTSAEPLLTRVFCSSAHATDSRGGHQSGLNLSLEGGGPPGAGGFTGAAADPCRRGRERDGPGRTRAPAEHAEALPRARSSRSGRRGLCGAGPVRGWASLGWTSASAFRPKRKRGKAEGAPPQSHARVERHASAALSLNRRRLWGSVLLVRRAPRPKSACWRTLVMKSASRDFVGAARGRGSWTSSSSRLYERHRRGTLPPANLAR